MINGYIHPSMTNGYFNPSMPNRYSNCPEPVPRVYCTCEYEKQQKRKNTMKNNESHKTIIFLIFLTKLLCHIPDEVKLENFDYFLQMNMTKKISLKIHSKLIVCYRVKQNVKKVKLHQLWYFGYVFDMTK